MQYTWPQDSPPTREEWIEDQVQGQHLSLATESGIEGKRGTFKQEDSFEHKVALWLAGGPLPYLRLLDDALGTLADSIQTNTPHKVFLVGDISPFYRTVHPSPLSLPHQDLATPLWF